jgi:protein tyrosine phosphatase (PTP) superfamily phosphohydrolase (DUF442 family)
MNSLEAINTEIISLKKIVEKLQAQGIKAEICKRPDFIQRYFL